MKTLRMALCLLWIFTPGVKSQTIDSLFALWEVEPSSCQRANRLVGELAKEGWMDGLPPFGRQTPQDEMELHIYSAMSAYDYSLARYGLSAERAERGARLAAGRGDSLLWSDNLSQQGIALQRMGRFDEAIRATLQGLRLDSLMDDTMRLSSSYHNLAALYLGCERPATALRYIRRAIRLEESLPGRENLSLRYAMAAEIYVQLDSLPQALSLALQAREIDRGAGNLLRAARRTLLLGDVSSAMGRLGDAEAYYLEAVRYFEEADNSTMLVIGYKQLGGLYLRKGVPQKAVAYWEKCARLARRVGNRYILQSAYEGLYKAYKPLDAGRSLGYLEKSAALKDSLYSERTNQLLSDYQVKYDTSQKEQTIRRQELELRVRHYWLLAVVSLALLFLVVAGVLLFYSTRYRAMAGRERRLNGQLRQLLSILSHDIKNPLAVLVKRLRVFAVRVGGACGDAEKREVGAMLDSVWQQYLLVDNLLAWGKCQSGQWKADPIPVDVRGVADEVARQMKAAFDAKRCTFEAVYPEGGQPVVALADRAVLQLVLRNLLHNALKYSYEGHPVWFRATAKGEEWHLEIVDEGTGLKPGGAGGGASELGTGGEQGTGLGLDICRKLLPLCGGRGLGVAPRAGGEQGTVAEFYIPRA